MDVEDEKAISNFKARKRGLFTRILFQDSLIFDGITCF